MTSQKVIFNEDVSPHLPIEDIENEQQFLFGLGLDCSSSMGPYEAVMPDCIKSFKAELMGSKQADEILVSLTKFGEFDSSVVTTGFQLVDDVPDDYQATGCTPLYDAIVVMQQQIYDGKGGGYLEQLQRAGIKPRGCVVVFSDGEEYGSQRYRASDTKAAIALLKANEITVAWVAFGASARDEAERLGVSPQNIRDFDDDESNLRRIFGLLSKSAISASKSAATGNSQNAFFV
jgi:uncharacterized protein YegL